MSEIRPASGDPGDEERRRDQDEAAEEAANAEAPPPTDPGAGSGIAILLAATAVVAAVVAGRASLLSSGASGAWQQAVRQQVQQAAAAVEDVRYVYGSEAPIAFLIARSNVQAEEYSAAADGLPADVAARLELEADVKRRFVESITEASFIARDPTYAREDGGFDIALRLRDVRNENPDLLRVDPNVPQATGDRASLRARMMMVATVPVAVAFLWGALGQAIPRRRRAFIVLGIAFLVIGLIGAVGVEVML